MLSLLLALQAAAAASPAPIAQCSVADVAPAKAVSGGAGALLGICGDRGAPLGAADRYSTVANLVTGSVLVVRQRTGVTQVLLVSPTQGGVSVDDITRDLTKLTGRFGDLGLGSATVDTSRFALDGSVGVTTAQGTRWLDLSPYVQFAATLITAALPATASQTAAAGN